MLSKETLQEIAKRAGVEVEALKTAISSVNEEKLELTPVHIYTDEELTTLKDNMGKEGYNRGKVAGVEMEFKEIRDELGIEVEGKDFRKLISKYSEKVLADAKMEPNKKITDLTNDLTKLQETLRQTEEEKKREISDLKSKFDKMEVESLVKSKITDEDTYLIYRGKYDIRKTETGFEIVDLKTNEVLKDKMQTPVKVEEHLNSFIESRKGNPAGRGGTDDFSFKTGTESLKTRSEVETYCEKNKVPLHERASILAKAMKNEGFDVKR